MTYPTSSSASDVWSLRDVYKAEAGGDWPEVPIPDPNFANVSLLINADGGAIEDSSNSNHTITQIGSPQLSTGIKKYGAASVLFQGNSSNDALSIPASTDFDFGSSDFTVEFWCYFNRTNVRECLAYINGNTSSYAAVRMENNSGTWRLLIPNVNNTGWRLILSGSSSVQTSQWYHVAIVRSGNTFTVYIDGVSEMSGSDSTSLPSGNISYVGSRFDTGFAVADPLWGHIDDFRITKGVARYTTNFTPPTEAFPTQ